MGKLSDVLEIFNNSMADGSAPEDREDFYKDLFENLLELNPNNMSEEEFTAAISESVSQSVQTAKENAPIGGINVQFDALEKLVTPTEESAEASRSQTRIVNRAYGNILNNNSQAKLNNIFSKLETSSDPNMGKLSDVLEIFNNSMADGSAPEDREDFYKDLFENLLELNPNNMSDEEFTAAISESVSQSVQTAKENAPIGGINVQFGALEKLVTPTEESTEASRSQTRIVNRAYGNILNNNSQAKLNNIFSKLETSSDPNMGKLSDVLEIFNNSMADGSAPEDREDFYKDLFENLLELNPNNMSDEEFTAAISESVSQSVQTAKENAPIGGINVQFGALQNLVGPAEGIS